MAVVVSMAAHDGCGLVHDGELVSACIDILHVRHDVARADVSVDGIRLAAMHDLAGFHTGRVGSPPAVSDPEFSRARVGAVGAWIPLQSVSGEDQGMALRDCLPSECVCWFQRQLGADISRV